jgi:hypothetical protein
MVTMEAVFKKIEEDLRKRANTEYKKLVFGELGSRIVENLMEAYDRIAKSFDTESDPAFPAWSEARDVFEDSIVNSLIESSKFVNGVMKFSTGDMIELGYNLDGGGRTKRLETKNVKPSSPLYWLIFYLEGIAGEYYFITEEFFERLVRYGRKPPESMAKFKSWGWYGKGFLIPANEYRARGFDQLPGSTHTLHPFSNTSPNELFEFALDGIDMKHYFGLAMERATSKM